MTERRVPIHNNDTERNVRHALLGRNNWQIFPSPKGGEVGSRMYALVLSARLTSISVQEYLEDVPRRFAERHSRDAAPIIPWAWPAARQAANSGAKSSRPLSCRARSRGLPGCVLWSGG